jgi:hypothetical protein
MARRKLCRMRALAVLLLVFGPVLSAPAAVGLFTWRRLAGQPDAQIDGWAAAAIAGLVVLGLVWRRGLVRQATMLALMVLWAGWLWMGLTDPSYDWTRVPALHAPDGSERFALLAIVLVYITLYILAEEGGPFRPS